jgi:hypothetical protein
MILAPRQAPLRRVIGTGAVLAVLLAAAAAVLPATALADGRLTMAAATPTNVVYGDGVTFTGTLTGAASGVAGVEVDLMPLAASDAAAPPAPVETAFTDASGRYTLTVTPSTNARYRAVLDADQTTLSTPVAVRVRPAITIAANTPDLALVRLAQTVTGPPGVRLAGQPLQVWFRPAGAASYSLMATQKLLGTTRGSEQASVLFRDAGHRPGTIITCFALPPGSQLGWGSDSTPCPAGPQVSATRLPAPLRDPSRSASVGVNGPANAFQSNGMWIWYVNKSADGTVAGIARQASAHHVNTVYIKSSDGSSYWTVFSKALVSALHSHGLKVCAWQYVYGVHPATEAKLGARAASYGADCLVIDAESEYEGRYGAAERYIGGLRAAVPASFPIGLAGFPYADYHPAFPYSVFLRPGGASYNLPQMYWKAIGTSVAQVFAHTYLYNSIYAAPIYPLGQLYMNPSRRDVLSFRRLAVLYGANGVSWWDWQEAQAKQWSALSAPLSAGPTPKVPVAPQYPLYLRGTRGDAVVWAQEHLRAWGYAAAVNGVFDAHLQTWVSTFQTDHRLPVTGELDQATWTLLLAKAPAAMSWTSGVAQSTVHGRARVVRHRPFSADLPDVRDELPAKDHHLPNGSLARP